MNKSRYHLHPLLPSNIEPVWPAEEELRAPEPAPASPWPLRLFFLVLLVTIVGITSIFFVVHATQKSEEQKLKAYAQALVAGLTTEELFAVKGVREDVGSPAYEHLKQKLLSMHRADTTFRFIYLMGRHNNQWIFYVDSEATSSPDISLPGDIYASINPANEEVLRTGKTMVYGPYRDEWGTWVSASVAVRDRLGNVRIFAVDRDAHAWQFLIMTAAAVPGCIMIFLLLNLYLIFLIDRRNTYFLNRLFTHQKLVWEQHQRLNLAVNASRDGMFDIVINTGQAYYSERFRKMLGFERDEKILAPFFSEFLNRVHPDDYDRVVTKIQDHMISGDPVVIDFRIRNRHDEYVWVSGRGSAYFNEFGKPLRFAGFITDITEQKKREHMRSEFIALASHQLRMPLTAIKWFASLLRADERGKLSVEQVSCLDKIETSNQRMIQLTNDLLNVSAIEEGVSLVLKKQSISCYQMVQNIIKELTSFARDRMIKVDIHKPKKDFFIIVDVEKMSDVLRNIIHNAIKYSAENSTVEIEMRQHYDTVEIIVKDYGIGIESSDQRHIFDKFFRARNARLKDAEGSGIGLYVAKKFIEAHEGSIAIRSHNGKGTTVSILIPTKKISLT